jgi:hypothetical protein
MPVSMFSELRTSFSIAVIIDALFLSKLVDSIAFSFFLHKHHILILHSMCYLLKPSYNSLIKQVVILSQYETMQEHYLVIWVHLHHVHYNWQHLICEFLLLVNRRLTAAANLLVNLWTWCLVNLHIPAIFIENLNWVVTIIWVVFLVTLFKVVNNRLDEVKLLLES